MFKDYWKYNWVLPVYRYKEPAQRSRTRSSPLRKERWEPCKSDDAWSTRNWPSLN